jgi:hypothetical protein
VDIVKIAGEGLQVRYSNTRQEIIDTATDLL